MKNLAYAVALPLALTAVAGAPSQLAPAPETIVSPSAVGEVRFPHRLHVEDFGIDCSECHHETGAARLAMPHEDYFEDFWIDCSQCHGNGQASGRPQTCAACHRASRSNVADETLSAKVVVHLGCGSCHPLGTGAAASAACSQCHSGARSER